MLKKLFTFSLMLLFASSLLVAQGTHVLKANGELLKLKQGKDLQEALNASKFTQLNGKVATNVVVQGKFGINNLPDTMNYLSDGKFNVNFGMNSGDIMFQYFQAPADLIIKGAGFSCSDDQGAADNTVSIRILKLNWTYEQLISMPAPVYMGNYPEDGDGFGGIDPFGESATGPWVDKTEGNYALPPWTDNAEPSSNNFEYDLWSDGGFGWPITAKKGEAGTYQWVDMSNLIEPTVSQGEVFAIALIHDGASVSQTDRIGYFSASGTGIPGWKYYESGRSSADDAGWWVRNYTWDFAVAIELTSDRAPKITNVTKLPTTVETGSLTVKATITDDNPSGGNAGVASAEIMYSLDTGKTYQSVAMTAQGDDIYAGDIPGQTPGTFITYKIKATDVEGLMSETGKTSYSIFATVNKDLLVIFNGGDEGRAKQLAPYYLQGLVPKYDLWAAYGPVKDFINFYDAILEIGSEGGPADDNRNAFVGYLASGSKKLAVVGQEVLGYLNKFTDSTFVAGDYEYDVLGVAKSYNDVINYQTGGDQYTYPTAVFPIAGTMYGDSLAQWAAANSLDTLFIDPNKRLGAQNWMDQFDSRTDIESEVFMTGLSKNDGQVRSIGHNFNAGDDVIFFMSADPLVLSSDSGWIGNSTYTPLAQFLRANIDDVKQIDNSIPNEFVLAQNYPNPFNPSTVINYSLTKASQVSLVVYDVLGREVATLFNTVQKPGTYQAIWNGVNNNGAKVNSGVYFYTITAGDFVQTKKMMLLK